MKLTFAECLCFLIVIMISLYACKGGGNKYVNRITQNSIVDNTNYLEEYYGEPVVIQINDDVIPLYDTLSVDNLIASYRYVPLSTDSGSYILGGCPIKVSDKYLIESGNMLSPDFKIFNNDGQYERNAITYGRGPNEIVNLFGFFVDYDRKEVTFISAEKILIYDFESQKTRIIRSNMEALYSNLARLENGDYVLLPNNDYARDGYNEEEIRPALIFYDSLFQVCDTLYRYTPKHRLIEGVTSGPLLGKQLSSKGGVTLYKDMIGDTVFRVSPGRKLIPEFVIDMPNDMRMTIRESEKMSYEKKEQKIIVRNYEVSKDYVFLSYHHDGVGRFGIWSKKTGQLLFRYVHPFDRHFISVLLDGKVAEIPIGLFQPNSNSFVSTIPAIQMKHIFPDIKDDDNPVAIEITLKSDM